MSEVIGRVGELAVAGAFLGQVSEGPAALLIEGDAGIGKTTLWEATCRMAEDAGMMLLTAHPAEAERGLPLSGYGDLFGSVDPDVLACLPPPQRRAVEVALLRREPPSVPADQRALGVATATLLQSLAGGHAPLLLAVDDGQWLDRSSSEVLTFAVRRLSGSPVGVAEVIRGPTPAARGMGTATSFPPSRLHRISVGPLPLAGLHRLLTSRVDYPFTRPNLIRIEQASGGNPFYALEIAAELVERGPPTPGAPLMVPDSRRNLALRRIGRLPPDTRASLLELAARGRPWAADTDQGTLAPAFAAGVIRLEPDGRIQFAHPLFGSALYSSLPEPQRRRLHNDIAEEAATIEEQALHRALGSGAPDAAIAEMLDEAAASAGARGAAAAAVELTELARRLTPADDREAVLRRDLELADRRYLAGDLAGARQHLEDILPRADPGNPRALVLLELASVRWMQGETGMELFDTAIAEADDRHLLARIHSRASAFSVDSDVALEYAQAALELIDEHEDPILYSFALHNRALHQLYSGRGADHEAIERGMLLQQDVAAWEMSTVPAYWSRAFDDFPTARARFHDHLRAFREHGDEASVCGILAQLAGLEVMTGHYEEARPLGEEAVVLAEQTGQDAFVLVALGVRGRLAAATGDLPAARDAGEAILAGLAGQADPAVEWQARALLGEAALAGGDAAEAERQLTVADQIIEMCHAREPANTRFHADLAEAVIHLGDLDRAEEIVSRIEHRALALPRPWVSLVAARTRGLLRSARGDYDGAQADYEAALETGRGLEMPLELARTHLALGRLHRRQKRKRLADTALREAIRICDEIGAPVWGEQARAELRRVGLRPRAAADLTETELRVAELAAQGLSSRQIADAAFISPKTASNVLTRVYKKLGIRSRAELGMRLAQRDAELTAGSAVDR